MEAEYCRLLFDYNRWANARILDKAMEAGSEAYFAPYAGLSFGNLHGTLVHLVGSEMTWWRRWTGNSGTPVTAENAPDLAALLAVREEAETRQAAFFATLSDDLVNRPNTWTAPNGNQQTQMLGYQVAHWMNHAMQYRSEAAVRLTAIDLSPGGIDMLGWLNTRG
jgi:uncharacterized damage-inducible protein DinB